VAVKLEGDVITSNGSILSGYEGHDGQSLNGSNASSMCSCHCMCLNGNRHKKYVIARLGRGSGGRPIHWALAGVFPLYYLEIGLGLASV